MKLSKFIFTAFLCLTISILPAQEPKGFTFKGRVEAYGEPCGDVLIEVLEGGELIDSIVTKNNGRFAFETISEREYMVTISKEGFKSKTIWVNTKKTQKLSSKPETFKFDVNLKKDKQTRYDELYEIPVALIKYDKDKEAFYMDDLYDDILDRKKDKIREDSRNRSR